MRLRTLEIKGFKSFADQTQIHFNEDVIGVVGPNGSGKSNIVDAIRWVLGEQKSKELRLDKMTSVIFNGTKKRKPSGAASVSLTFENTKNLLPTEYNMVTVTRMLYRSGESEYRLNNVPCRLKDVTSLFLDTGIGSNSYAIIALNMVDDLLSDKENARRRMFEQAAGISKYKKRKRETLNKLKNTEADLERIEDLLFEIEGNLKSLEKQAKRAERYYAIKKEYKEIALDLAVYQVSEYKEDYKSIEARLTSEMDGFRQLEIDNRQLEATIEEEKRKNLDYEKNLSESQKALNSLVGSIREMENEKRILEQRSLFTKDNKEKLSTQINVTKSRITQLDDEVVDYRSRINEEKRKEAELDDLLEEAEEELAKIKSSHSTLKSDLDQYLEAQQNMERAIFELEKNKAINVNQLESLGRSLLQNQQEILNRQGEIDTLGGQLTELTEKEAKQGALIESLEKKEGERQIEIERTEKEITTLNEKIAITSRSLDAKENEFKLTKSMVDNLEGFPESIKFLSNNKEWKTKAPLLSDIIYVNEEFRVAIENYLDPYLNYYVVENMEAALNAVKLLNRTQKGKANFFLLDAFKDYAPSMTTFGNFTRATELVEVDGKYTHLVSHLLSNVFVTEKEAGELTEKIADASIVLLSKSGGFIKKKFSLSGGSVGLFEGKKIGRKKNLEILEKAIAELDKQKDKLTSTLLELKANLKALKANSSKVSINTEKKIFNQLSQQKVSIQTKVENFESFASGVTTKIEENQLRISKIKDNNKVIEEQLIEKRKTAAAAKSKLANTDDSFKEVANKMSVANHSFNEKNIAFIKQQNMVNTIQQELTFREKQLVELKEKLENDLVTINSSDGEIMELLKKMKALDAKLLDAYEIKKERSKTLGTAEQAYFKARGYITEMEDNLRKSNRKYLDTQSLINNLKDKFNDIKLNLSAIGERMKLEFQISINEVIKMEPKEGIKRVELQARVDKLKKRLDNYGEINPMAVEAYNEIKERYDTITQQRDDVVAAKNSLIETITEIETTATAQFMEAFEKVRVAFIEVFQSLFTKDDICDLKLEDPENPLDSRITITAKPKGKRPQSISQLSGGEKTLTATALLFALYLLKPAPFCIFDEVDAPLDDANIEKFNNIIKKFAERSQFIVVTHNKQTMAAVDVIYGVHMQEMGVSSVTPVDFRTLEHSNILQAAEG